MPEMLAWNNAPYYIDYTLSQVGVWSNGSKPPKTTVTSVTGTVFCPTSPLTLR
jgi:ferric iron reductase protein FhuF